MKKIVLGIAIATTLLAACNTVASSDLATAERTNPSNPTVVAAPGAAIAGEVRITLTVSATFAGAKAKAKYKNRGGERELQVEAENLNGIKGQTTTVCLNNSSIGKAVVDVFGNARLNINSTLGNTVPNVASGDRIALHNGISCTSPTIASGQF